MPSLKTLGLAAAIGLSPACEQPVEQTEPPRQEAVTPEVNSACERFRAALGMEVVVVIEQMASDPAAWKLFPPSVAEAAWKDAHAESMAAAAELKDQGACLNTIKEGK